MEINIDTNLLNICKEILKENKTPEEWAEIESDDMFQIGSYVGGFDATEMEFCFSFYKNEKEFWFQISLEEIRDIVRERKTTIQICKVE